MILCDYCGNKAIYLVRKLGIRTALYYCKNHFEETLSPSTTKKFHQLHDRD